MNSHELILDREKLFIKNFLAHVKPLNLHPKGALLLIGPAPSLIDFAAIEHEIDLITSILFVETHSFMGTRALQLIREQHPALSISVQDHTDYRDLTRKFDTICSFGTGPYFFGNRHYRKIPQLLRPGGKYYGTSTFRSSEENIAAAQASLGRSSIIIIDDLPFHPRYKEIDQWVGVVIEKAPR